MNLERAVVRIKVVSNGRSRGHLDEGDELGRDYRSINFQMKTKKTKSKHVKIPSTKNHDLDLDPSALTTTKSTLGGYSSYFWCVGDVIRKRVYVKYMRYVNLNKDN